MVLGVGLLKRFTKASNVTHFSFSQKYSLTFAQALKDLFNISVSFQSCSETKGHQLLKALMDLSVSRIQGKKLVSKGLVKNIKSHLSGHQGFPHLQF